MWFPTLRGYQRRWLKGDLVAGVGAGAVVIPQAMAYATIAGMPVETGLYTCMVPMLVYAALGGARTVSVSTTSTIAVLVASTVAGLSPRSSEAVASAAFTLTVLVGVCLLVMRLFRLGSLIENISPATLAGIRVGVGLTVAASQLPILLGVAADPGATGFFARMVDACSQVPDANRATVLVSVAALVVLLLLKRFAPRVPGQLVVVAAGILLIVTTSVEQHGLQLIDKVPTGLPHLSAPAVADVAALLPGALAIAVMAFLETVIVARTNAHSAGPAIDADQELLAIGVGGVAGGLTQSLPPAGGFSQSAMNVRSGAHTQLASVTTACLAVLTALVLAPLLDNLPSAVLAAMVLMAVVGLLSPADFRRFARLDRAELWVAVVVAGLSLVGGMLLGVAVGVGLTWVLVVRDVNLPRVSVLYRRSEGGWTTDPDAAGEGDTQDGTLLLHLDGALYTGNAQPTVDALLRLVQDRVGGSSSVVLDCSAVRRATVPLVDALRTMSEELDRTGLRLQFAEFRSSTLVVLRRSQWFSDQEQAGRVSPSVDAAIDRAQPPSNERCV